MFIGILAMTVNMLEHSFDLDFNPALPSVMHVDINSCFATIEQQANPLLRGKPVAVAAYTTGSGCVLAPSVEAKTFGVQTGMRVRDAKQLCPDLVVKEPDPWKYRHVHKQFRQLLSEYTADYVPKSIDEFVLHLDGYPAFEAGSLAVGQEIKMRVLDEIGDWIRVSVGVGPNRFLAKMAAGLTKPDGLDEIHETNFLDIYQTLDLVDLHGINVRNKTRLYLAGITSVMEMYEASVGQLQQAFGSIAAYYWYLRLRGWEIDTAEFGRRSYGNSYALPKPFSRRSELAPIMTKLVEKMSRRLRKAGYQAQGVYLYLSYGDGTRWHQSLKTKRVLFESRDIYREIMTLYEQCPYVKPVRKLAVSCFNLVQAEHLQMDLFGMVAHQEKIAAAVDDINERWGDYVVSAGRMLDTGHYVPDRIAFGGVKELEEFMVESAD